MAYCEIMNSIKENKLWNIALVMVFAVTCMLASCIKNEDEVVTTPECAITSFNVGSITSKVKAKRYDSQGNATDTIVNKVISSSEIHFNIDQLNGHIYSIDSLPNWVDLTKVVPSFSSNGTVFGKVVKDSELYYPLTSGKDSIDFTKTVELICGASDGISYKTYKVDIYKSENSIDTLEWTSVNSNIQIVGQSKPFFVNNNIFAFAENSIGSTIVTYANRSNPEYWSTPAVIPVKKESVVVFNGKFYGLGDDGCIYSSSANDKAQTWTKASEQKVEKIIAADAYYIYAFDGENIISSTDLENWVNEGNVDTDMLPETCVSSSYLSTRTNENLLAVSLTGISGSSAPKNVCWFKISSENKNSNQKWGYIKVTEDNPYGLPDFEKFSVTLYKGELYAIGTKGNEYYSILYRSSDNGITWHNISEMYPTPADIKTKGSGASSIVTVGDEFWIINEGGMIWRGSIV